MTTIEERNAVIELVNHGAKLDQLSDAEAVSLAEAYGAEWEDDGWRIGAPNWTASHPACDWHSTKADAAREYCALFNLAD